MYLLDGEESDNLIYRKIRENDAPEWLRFFQDPRTFLYWNEERESPEQECAKWYRKQFRRYELGQGGMNALVEKKSGKLVGHCGLLVQTVDGHQELEIGYSLLPEFWGKGYASEAAMKCRNEAFQRSWAASLISIISLSNVPSQRVAMKNGMQIDKTTIYNANQVYVFRITKLQMHPAAG